MPIIERDSYGGRATTYTLNLAELCKEHLTTAQTILADELKKTGKLTLHRDELQRIKDILSSVDI